MCHGDADVEPVGCTCSVSGKPACCSDLVLADDTPHNNPLPLSHLAPNLAFSHWASEGTQTER